MIRTIGAIVVLASIFLAPGCKPVTVDTSCTAFGPLTYDPDDSKETKDGIKRHNAAWDELCL